jgi:hypothetical protein
MNFAQYWQRFFYRNIWGLHELPLCRRRAASASRKSSRVYFDHAHLEARQHEVCAKVLGSISNPLKDWRLLFQFFCWVRNV